MSEQKAPYLAKNDIPEGFREATAVFLLDANIIIGVFKDRLNYRDTGQLKIDSGELSMMADAFGYILPKKQPDYYYPIESHFDVEQYDCVAAKITGDLLEVFCGDNKPEQQFNLTYNGRFLIDWE